MYVFLISIQRLYSKRNLVYGTLCRVDSNLTLCRLQHMYVPWATLCQIDLNPMPESTYPPAPQSGTKNFASDLVGVWFGSLASVATLDYCPRLARGKEWTITRTCKQPCSIGSDSCVVNRPTSLKYNEVVSFLL
jgi:hypothetical protein